MGVSLLLDSGHVASVVGGQNALAVVEQDELVTPRIDNDGAQADRNVERRDDDAATSIYEPVDRWPDGVYREVGLGAGTLGLQHEFGVAIWKAHASA